MEGLWMVTAVANVVMVAVYASIAGMLMAGLTRGGQWRTNPILVATFAVFTACTLGHGIHLEHTLLPLARQALGAAPAADVEAVSQAARATFSDPRLLAWDVTTAAVAGWYWTLRGRFVIISRGAALCEDMEVRARHALELHDDVVQGLARAHLALEAGRPAEARAAVDDALRASKRIIGDVLGPPGGIGLGPGDLRRRRPWGG
jgi:signal transduction histidine kinase